MSNEQMREALKDILSGWRYIRHSYGDLYGVGWDRCETKAVEALASQPFDMGCEAHTEFHSDGIFCPVCMMLEIDGLKAELSITDKVQRLRIAGLKEQLASQQSDTERLDWLLKNDCMRVQGGAVLDCSDGLTCVTRGHKTAREAIDAAMVKESK